MELKTYTTPLFRFPDVYYLSNVIRPVKIRPLPDLILSTVSTFDNNRMILLFVSTFNTCICTTCIIFHAVEIHDQTLGVLSVQTCIVHKYKFRVRK